MSYDIACQFCVNFFTRMLWYPTEMQLDLDEVNVEFVVPKFHIMGHNIKCQARFSLGFRQHVGRTDGKNIERGWAAFNGLSMATREMSRGAREDTLDHQFGDWNFQRILTFGRGYLI